MQRSFYKKICKWSDLCSYSWRWNWSTIFLGGLDPQFDYRQGILDGLIPYKHRTIPLFKIVDIYSCPNMLSNIAKIHLNSKNTRKQINTLDNIYLLFSYTTRLRLILNRILSICGKKLVFSGLVQRSSRYWRESSCSTQVSAAVALRVLKLRHLSSISSLRWI